MTPQPELALNVAETKRPEPPEFPLSYGRMLMERASRHGWTRSEFAERADISDLTAQRTLDVKPGGSILAAIKLRKALIDAGDDIPPVPGGATEWNADGEVAPDPADPKARHAARRLRLLRDRAGFDVAGLAIETGLLESTVEDFESGRRAMTLTDLEMFASAIGHDVRDLMYDHPPPPTTLGPYDKLHARRRLLTPEQRQQLDEYARREFGPPTSAPTVTPEQAAVKKAHEAKRLEARKPKVQQQGKPPRKPRR